MDRECRSNGGKRWARNYADRPADPLRISQRIGFSIEHSRGLARRSMPNDSCSGSASAAGIQREGCGARIHQHKNYAEGLNV